MDWSKAPTEKGGFRLALGSFIEEHENKVLFLGATRVFDFFFSSTTLYANLLFSRKLQIVTRSDLVDDMYASQHSDFAVLAETDSYYPITKVLWEPYKVSIPCGRNTHVGITTVDG